MQGIKKLESFIRNNEKSLTVFYDAQVKISHQYLVGINTFDMRSACCILNIYNHLQHLS